jgi:ribonuclease BN (tRNA processing enzyme)
MNATPAQPDRLVLLGTKGGPAIRKGGPSPTANLLVIGGYSYVIDCGLGVTRGLVEAGIALPELRCIIITHLHSDHVLELGPLIHTAWTAGLKEKVVVYGPAGTAAVWQGFLASLSYDIAIRIEDEGRPDLARMVEVREYGDGAVFTDERVKVTALRVLHPPVADCFALRFDHGAGSVVFSADTTYFPPLAAFARGADILVHEAIYEPGVDRLVARVGNGARLKQHLLASHTLAEDVGRIATEAGVGLLVLHHLVPADDPLVTEQHWIDALRSQYQGPLVVGRDGLVLPLAKTANGSA